MMHDYTHARLFFSNSLDQLCTILQKNLFPHPFSEKGELTSTPFSKRIVVVPSYAMEAWIEQRCASSLSIAAGITFSLLDSLLPALFGSTPLPSSLSLLLLLEQELAVLEREWPQLAAYTKRKEKRRLSLARSLLPSLLRQRLYGTAPEKRGATSWEEALFLRLRAQLPTLADLLPTLEPHRIKTTIHCFAFPYLPPLYFSFLRQLPFCFFYQLSPCQEFWSDETESHPLLTAYGRVGKEMARLIEESDLITEEAYVPPEGKSRLVRLQRELLFLQEELARISHPPSEEIAALPRECEKCGLGTEEDTSLQCDGAVTPYQEVKNLHASLCRLLHEKKGELTPKDIFILAPDITLYAPFLQSCFEGSLPYKIEGLPSTHPEKEALLLWLDLPARRFSVPALLSLFRHPLFLKKRGWDLDAIEQIEAWIAATGIRWGLDPAHRQELLGTSAPLKGATWEEGIDHLLEELALPYTPTRISFSQAELLGEWKELLSQLSEDRKIVDTALTLRGWADRLLALHTTYFSSSDELAPLLEKLAACEKEESRLYPFPLLEMLLPELLNEEKETRHGRELEAISCASLSSFRALPAKVICLLGMNYETFPRKEEELLFSPPTRGYIPSSAERDRMYFLETLLSARDKLFLSYLYKDPYDQSPWPPSSLLSSLLPYIGKTELHPMPPPPPAQEAPEGKPLFSSPKVFACPPFEGVVTLTDFLRAFRSPLHHYLFHRGIKITPHLPLSDEEPLHLSPLQRALLRKQALSSPHEEVWRRAEKEGMWPIGPLRTLAEQALAEELSLLPSPLSSRPLDITVGGLRLVGNLEGFFPGGWGVLEKKTVKGAVRAWPCFLLATLVDPTLTRLHFFRDQKELPRPFDDPLPLLKPFCDAYLLSLHTPAPLFPDWIEPLLNGDPRALAAAPCHDTTLSWASRGQKLAPPDLLIHEWKEEVEKLYKEMYDAWF